MKSEYIIIKRDNSIEFITKKIRFAERVLLSFALLFKKDIVLLNPRIQNFQGVEA